MTGDVNLEQRSSDLVAVELPAWSWWLMVGWMAAHARRDDAAIVHTVLEEISGQVNKYP